MRTGITVPSARLQFCCPISATRDSRCGWLIQRISLRVEAVNGLDRLIGLVRMIYYGLGLDDLCFGRTVVILLDE